MIPGTTNLPVRSTIVASAGARSIRDAPMSRMRPFSITMAASVCGAAPVPSMRVAWVSTVTCAEALAASRMAAAKPARASQRMTHLLPAPRHAPLSQGMGHVRRRL